MCYLIYSVIYAFIVCVCVYIYIYIYIYIYTFFNFLFSVLEWWENDYKYPYLLCSLIYPKHLEIIEKRKEGLKSVELPSLILPDISSWNSC